MNTLESTLVDIIAKITESAEAAGEFLSSEVPVAVQQLLAWEFWSSIVFASIAGIIFTSAVIVAITRMKAGKAWEVRDNASRYDEWTDQFSYGGIMSIALLASVPSFVIMLVNSMVALKVFIAPHIFLIEYAARLVR